jgi:hypothetical protein
LFFVLRVSRYAAGTPTSSASAVVSSPNSSELPMAVSGETKKAEPVRFWPSSA